MTQRTSRSSANGLATTKARRADQEYTYGTAKIIDVPIKKFITNEAYQRALHEPTIEKIGRNHSQDRYGLPVVRSLDDGTFEVVDGQNRIEYARRQGWSIVTCQVADRGTVEEAAALYVELREDQRPLRPADTFKGRLAQRAPWALEMEASLTKRGLLVTGSKHPNAVPLSTMKGVYARRGIVRLERVIDVILSSWPDGESRRFGSSIITGIEEFLFDTVPNADTDRLVRALRGVTAQRLEALGDQRWHGWRMADSRGGNKPAAVAEEIAKLYGKTRAGA